MSVALSTTVIAFVIGLQTYWISRSLGRVEAGLDGHDGRFANLDRRVDALSERIDGLRAEMHRDLTTHTEAIADLRARGEA